MSGDSEDKEQKTEDASHKRLEDMRREGQIPRSPEVTSTAALVGGAAVMAMTIQTSARSLAAFADRAMHLENHRDPFSLLASALPVLADVALPALVGSAIFAVIAGVAQTRGLFELSLLEPKLQRLDPITNLPNLLPGKQQAIEIGKYVLKFLAVGMVVYFDLSAQMPRLVALASAPAPVAARDVLSVAGTVVLHALLALAALAALDFFLALRKFNADSRMSKQELKDEFKQEEGDQQVKRRARALARERMRQRSVASVKQATVLITNPTHLAVALRYVRGKDAAPIVLAKSEDEIALRMRAEARKHGVPIIENKPLARALHKTARVGKAIPMELFMAAAEVIAQVMKIRGGDRS